MHHYSSLTALKIYFVFQFNCLTSTTPLACIAVSTLAILLEPKQVSVVMRIHVYAEQMICDAECLALRSVEDFSG